MKMQTIRILYLVWSARCEHETYALPVLYCGTVMEAFIMQRSSAALAIASTGPIVCTVQCLTNSCFTTFC